MTRHDTPNDRPNTAPPDTGHTANTGMSDQLPIDDPEDAALFAMLRVDPDVRADAKLQARMLADFDAIHPRWPVRARNADISILERVFAQLGGRLAGGGLLAALALAGYLAGASSVGEAYAVAPDSDEALAYFELALDATVGDGSEDLWAVQ